MTRFAPAIAPLGFYPVLPDAHWVQRALTWGVRTVQLRAKAADHDAHSLEQQVRAAVAAGQAHPGAQVFINDHWQLALACGAYGVHLGQEDWAALSAQQQEQLRQSGLRLGLSSHTPQELQRALEARPTYAAIGPVYPTTLKRMPYAPVGLQQLRDWTALAAPCPIVAIGGITLAQFAGVLDCGVAGVAVVSALTQASDPQAAARQALDLCAAQRVRDPA